MLRSSLGATKVAEWHQILPKSGERVSGDAAVFRHTAGTALFAVIDALGHGPHAAEVANAGVAYLQGASLDQTPAALIQGLHQALAHSRGAAAMVCRWRDGKLEGCGVGNVELTAIRARIPIVLTPGIVGTSLRTLRPFEGPAGPGSRFVVYSDGISARFSNEQIGLLKREDACKLVIEKHRREHDDATVMVVDIEA
jgi:negative regulator of sigma-B (phosphoserine phosphatase)